VHSRVSQCGGERLVPTVDIVHDVYPDVLESQHQVSQVENDAVNTLPLAGVHLATYTHDAYPGVLDSQQQVSRSQNNVTKTISPACAQPASLPGLNVDAG
jgi:hypothetical protein